MRCDATKKVTECAKWWLGEEEESGPVGSTGGGSGGSRALSAGGVGHSGHSVNRNRSVRFFGYSVNSVTSEPRTDRFLR
jgi:hypothetical protein